MSRYSSLAIILLIVVVVQELRAGGTEKGEQTNFIFILTDDHSYEWLGCSGNKLIKTPEIDRLANDGVMFSNAHITSAICTPSRVSIFLSQHERMHGVNFNSGTSVSDEAWEMSYPMVMKKQGYYTGYIGKNHAPIGDGGYGSGVMDESFDYWYGGHGHLRFYPKKNHKIFKGAKYDTQVEILDEGVNDFLSNEHRLEGAKHFLSNRPSDQPFCLSICLNLPHGAGTGSMELLPSDSVIYRTLYRDKKIPLPENYIPKAEIKNPKLPADIYFASERQTGYNFVDTEDAVRERIIRTMQTVTGIDGLLGNLRETLEKMDLDDNTIIVFSSDHGIFFGEFGLGGKALCYEVCTHVPMIVFNPTAPIKARGKVLDELVQSIDIAPTMLDYAGIEIPESFQGKSLKPMIEGDVRPVRDYLYTENLWSTQFGNPRCEAIQNKEWKYIRYYKNENLKASVKIQTGELFGISQTEMLYAVHDPDIALYRSFVEGPLKGEPAVFEELFHLSVDPSETSNLAMNGEYREILEKMRKAWDSEIKRARGEGSPKVYRYTKDSMLEKQQPVVHE